MNISITKNPLEANAITHGGIFHADEVMATYILSMVFEKLTVYRTYKVPETIKKDTIIYDIGHGRYDHHQTGGNGMRANQVPYSSCGLIWKSFGTKVLTPLVDADAIDYVWKDIDRDFIQGIDAIDNGTLPKMDYPASVMTISGGISSFNPNWDSTEDSDEAFLRAVTFAGIIFENVLKRSIASAKAEEIIEDAISNSHDHMMVLERFAPWQDFIFISKNPKAADVWFVIFPSLRGGYNFQCVPDVFGGYGQRKPVPSSWKGLRDEAFRKETGVETATFCHPAGFIGGAETLTDALKLAAIAVNS